MRTQKNWFNQKSGVCKTELKFRFLKKIIIYEETKLYNNFNFSQKNIPDSIYKYFYNNPFSEKSLYLLFNWQLTPKSAHLNDVLLGLSFSSKSCKADGYNKLKYANLAIIVSWKNWVKVTPPVCLKSIYSRKRCL